MNWSFTVSELIVKRRIIELAAIRKQEQTNKILQILHENEAGLTSVQIALRTETGLQRNLLSQLQKQGLIKQKKGYSTSGTPCYIYVLGRKAVAITEKPRLSS